MHIVGFYCKNYYIPLIFNRIIKHLTLELLTIIMCMSSPILYLYSVSVKEGQSFKVYLQDSRLFKAWFIMF